MKDYRKRSKIGSTILLIVGINISKYIKKDIE